MDYQNRLIDDEILKHVHRGERVIPEIVDDIVLVLERLANRRHRREREQLTVGQRRIRRSRRQHDACQAKWAAIEVTQRQRVGDRSAALQRRRAMRMACRHNTTEQDQGDNQKSHARLIS